MTKKGGSRSKASLHPSDYADLLQTIKKRIQESRINAYRAVNKELIELYWNIGREIASRQEQEGWGKSVVERLSSDLRKEFPSASGFSAPQSLVYAPDVHGIQGLSKSLTTC